MQKSHGPCGKSLERSSLKKLSTCLMITALISFIINACAGFSNHQSREPRTIIIRNSTDMFIEEVLISAIKSSSRYTRIGAVSPVPSGVSQVIGRSADAPELPNDVIICWLTRVGRKCQNSDLRLVLKQSSGPEDAIVIEVLSFNEVKVHLEPG